MTVKDSQSAHKIHRRPATAQLKFLNSSNSQILTESSYCQEGGMLSAPHLERHSEQLVRMFP